MPEIPEMETYKTLLSGQLLHRQIHSIEVGREKSLNVPVAQFQSRVEGCVVAALSRRAKHLLFHLDTGDVLLLHLMLGGWMFYGTDQERPDRTVQIALGFGDKKLHFIGLRLGYLHLLADGEWQERLAVLGPEPLEPSFTGTSFASLLGARRATLKPTLTDQHILAGIGNCYADEICYEARIRPSRTTDSLSTDETAALYRAMREVLLNAIRHGGYMEHPLYMGDTLTGGFDSRCAVYDRGGEPCLRCGTALVGEKLASRKVFYCPECQH